MIKREYKKLLSNTGLLAIGSFASSLLGMLLIPFYTSVLSTADYGISDLIVTTTSLLYPFTTMAISEAIMRFALDKHADRKSIYSIGLSMIGIGYIILLLCTPLIKKTTIGEYYTFFMLYYFCYCVHTITSYFVKGIEKIKIYSFAGLLNSIIVISCNLFFLLFLKIGIVGYLLSSILGHGLTALFMIVRGELYKYVIPIWRIDRVLFREMLRYSIPIIPNSISWWIANSSDKYVLNHFADVSQVGIYSISYKIPTIMMTVMGFFISAWQISAVDDFGSQKSQQFFSDIFRKCFTVNVILASFLIAFSKVIGTFLYSAEFFVAWRYVPVLVIANVFNVMASFMGTIYTSAKKTKMLSISTLLGAMINIIMNFLLIPTIGAMGAAIATAFSYFVMWIIRMINTRDIMRLTYNIKKMWVLITCLLIEVILVSTDEILTHIGSYCIFIIILILNKNAVVEVVYMIMKALLSKTNLNKEKRIKND